MDVHLPIYACNCRNIHNLSGYKIKDVFINKKHDCLKDQILNYKYITFKQYANDFMPTGRNVLQRISCIWKEYVGV